jgi:hypothetical protein
LAGALLVADDVGSIIWRVTPAAALGEAQPVPNAVELAGIDLSAPLRVQLAQEPVKQSHDKKEKSVRRRLDGSGSAFLKAFALRFRSEVHPSLRGRDRTNQTGGGSWLFDS